MKDLSRQAKIFIYATIVAGSLLFLWHIPQITLDSLGLYALTALAVVGQVYKVEGATVTSSYNLSWIIYGITFVLFGVPEAMFVIMIAHIAEWIVHRYPWYIQTFNIGNFFIVIWVTSVIYNWTNPDGSLLNYRGPLSLLVSFGVFTLLNHMMVGTILRLARGQSYSQSGVLSGMTLMIDYSLLGMGLGAALLWTLNPYSAIFITLPVYLIYRTLRLPALQRQAELDPKTQLYNARYFSEVLEQELYRAERFERPLTLVMADMDLLRNINNAYGHVAGDVVLTGVADILREDAGDYDTVARFGGEEFAILLPETKPEQVFLRIEALRKAIESKDFEVSTSVQPIKATMSFGIAGRGDHNISASELINCADLALYQSKSKGRNLVSVYSEEFLPPEDGETVQISAAEPNELILDPIEHTPRVKKTRVSSEGGKQTKTVEEKPPPEANAGGESKQPSPEWMINLYITGILIVGLIIIGLTLRHYQGIDWLGLAAFAILLVLTEALSIEIYAKDISISTSTAIILPGVLLFGPVGALVLSLLLSGTAAIKHRSQLQRIFFNFSNHLLYSSIIALGVWLTGSNIIEHPIYYQLGLSIAAGIISYLHSTINIANVMSLSGTQKTRTIWEENFRWLLPYYFSFGVVTFPLIIGYDNVGIVGVIVVLVPLFMLRISQIQYIDRTKASVQKIREKNIELEWRSKEITELNEGLMLALAQIENVHDPYVFGHSQNVSAYGTLIASELGLHPDQIEIIRKGGLLHDIGKLGIPDSILHKPGALSDREYERIKQHVNIGVKIIERIPSLQPLMPIIRSHHERYDGKGYPDGLKGEEIPIAARIIALVDSVHAMASDRAYRKALSPEEIRDEVTREAGYQFDPIIVEMFLKAVDRGDIKLGEQETQEKDFRDVPLVLGRSGSPI